MSPSKSRAKTETSKALPETARLEIRVQPGASKNRLTGRAGSDWKVTVTAPPTGGKANRACVEMVARLLKVPPSSVTLVRGKAARRKVMQIEGMSQQEADRRLAEAVS